MVKEHPYIFDATLRDGAQRSGVDVSVEDKRAIAKTLDRLGVDYIEGGWLGANPTYTSFFENLPNLERATFTAFSMTKRPGRSADNDPGLAAVLGARVGAVYLMGKTWDYNVDVALGIEKSKNVAMIGNSMAASIAKGHEALSDAEHFFDGYRANPDLALACLQSALDAGAR